MIFRYVIWKVRLINQFIYLFVLTVNPHFLCLFGHSISTYNVRYFPPISLFDYNDILKFARLNYVYKYFIVKLKDK